MLRNPPVQVRPRDEHPAAHAHRWQVRPHPLVERVGGDAEVAGRAGAAEEGAGAGVLAGGKGQAASDAFMAATIERATASASGGGIAIPSCAQRAKLRRIFAFK